MITNAIGPKDLVELRSIVYGILMQLREAMSHEMSSKVTEFRIEFPFHETQDVDTKRIHVMALVQGWNDSDPGRYVFSYGSSETTAHVPLGMKQRDFVKAIAYEVSAFMLFHGLHLRWNRIDDEKDRFSLVRS